MTAVFFTYTYHDDPDEYKRFGGEKLEKSLKHFYPDIPFVYFKNILAECGDPSCSRTIEPVLGMKLAEQYDHIIKFDCDSVVVDKLDELFTNDYDIAGVRNQNDKSHAGICGPFTVEGVDILNYMNGGLISVRNKQFWKDWYDYNEEHKVHTWGLAAQDSLNILAWKSGKYKTKLLDPVGDDLYYGISNTFGDYGGCEAADQQGNSHWDSWKRVFREGDSLYLISPRTGKKVKNKVFHHAGGGRERLTQEFFSEAAWNRICEITSG